MKDRCECGCGELAPINVRNDANKGYVKGEPKRFILGHTQRGRKRTPEQNRINSESKKGLPKSEAHRKNMSAAQKGITQGPLSPEHRANISAALRGENGPAWKGGITPEHRRIRASTEYKEWRASVFERDDFTCQHCPQRGGTLHAHHIKRFSQFPELQLVVANGITLCEECHKNEHSRATNENGNDRNVEDIRGRGAD